MGTIKFKPNEEKDIFDVVYEEVQNTRVAIFKILKKELGLNNPITNKIDDLMSDLSEKAPGAALDHLAKGAGLIEQTNKTKRGRKP